MTNKKTQNMIFSLSVVVFFVGCTPRETPDTEESLGEESSQVVRTADPTTRGLSTNDFPRIKELATNVYSYEQLRGVGGDEPFTTVSMFVVTEEGVLVADGQGNPTETKRMVDEIRTITEKPITHVVICSDHGDHTGGNSEFPSDAIFFSSSKSKSTLENSAANPNRRRNDGTEAPPIIIPTETVDDRRTITMGGKEIQIFFLGRAHTGGDLHVYLPEEKILFMSEAFLNRIFPAMRSAYPSEWVEVIDKAQNMDVEIYIPGHGFVEEPEVSREELAEFRKALETVIKKVTNLHEDLLVDQELDVDWEYLNDWRLSKSQGPTAIKKILEELKGELQ